jgi:hypothetical protein
LVGAATEVAEAVLTISDIEQTCESQGITLVVHPVIRRALGGYEESFYIGAACFLRGESDGKFFLPLDRSYVQLRFVKRRSAGGHPILRLDTPSASAMAAIKRAVEEQRL